MQKAVTRQPEWLGIRTGFRGKREVDAGQVRLRKWVDTEPAQADVDLKRETARVTRERVSSATRSARSASRSKATTGSAGAKRIASDGVARGSRPARFAKGGR